MSSASDPAIDAEVVTFDVDVTNGARGLYIGGTGNLAVITSRGNTRTFYNAQAGSVVPIRVRRVLSSGTTATNILALY
jgi:hypothetical protein